MGRIARVVLPGVWHHVAQRGNRRQSVFFEDADRHFYLQLLGRHCSKHGAAITGDCLMTNHVHVISPPLAKRASHALSARLTPTTPVAESPSRGDRPFLAEPLLFVPPGCRTPVGGAAELNPVRAGMVASAGEWAWSSAAAHLGGRDISGFLGLTEWRDRWRPETWADALAEGLTDPALLERIREATRTGRPAGSDDFVKQAEKHSNRRPRPMQRGPKSKSVVSPDQMDLGVW
jgi:putative transposase